MQLSSRLIEEAVEQMSSLPGIGQRTALRLVLQMLKRSDDEVERFARAFTDLKKSIRSCKVCHNLSDEETCGICRDPARDKSIVCVVEDIRDVMAIEATQLFKGTYHVLGGIISPMDGIGPNDLTINDLTERMGSGEIKEVILALSTTMEGETTSFYIFKKLAEFDLSVSSIARGVAVGDELQYADELTLGRSIQNRVPYENSLS
jgi:recombination protein RecR